jgi:hypothetical protein
VSLAAALFADRLRTRSAPRFVDISSADAIDEFWRGEWMSTRTGCAAKDWKTEDLNGNGDRTPECRRYLAP